MKIDFRRKLQLLGKQRRHQSWI